MAVQHGPSHVTCSLIQSQFTLSTNGLKQYGS